MEVEKDNVDIEVVNKLLNLYAVKLLIGFDLFYFILTRK